MLQELQSKLFCFENHLKDSDEKVKQEIEKIKSDRERLIKDIANEVIFRLEDAFTRKPFKLRFMPYDISYLVLLQIFKKYIFNYFQNGPDC